MFRLVEFDDRSIRITNASSQLIFPEMEIIYDWIYALYKRLTDEEISKWSKWRGNKKQRGFNSGNTLAIRRSFIERRLLQLDSVKLVTTSRKWPPESTRFIKLKANRPDSRHAGGPIKKETGLWTVYESGYERG